MTIPTERRKGMRNHAIGGAHAALDSISTRNATSLKTIQVKTIRALLQGLENFNNTR